MQNKGFVKVFAVLLALVCIFYLSFSFVVKHYEGKAEKIAAVEGEAAGQHYIHRIQCVFGMRKAVGYLNSGKA